MFKGNIHRSGFTLLELMLVIGMMVIIAAMSRDFYGGFAGQAQLENEAKTIIYDLRSARDKAINGLNDQNWGIHFVNGASDYYEFFSTPDNYSNASTSVLATSYLKNGMTYDFPAEGANLDIIFNKITGQVASSSLIIKTGLNTRTISVQAQGLIN